MQVVVVVEFCHCTMQLGFPILELFTFEVMVCCILERSADRHDLWVIQDRLRLREAQVLCPCEGKCRHHQESNNNRKAKQQTLNLVMMLAVLVIIKWRHHIASLTVLTKKCQKTRSWQGRHSVLFCDRTARQDIMTEIQSFCVSKTKTILYLQYVCDFVLQ